MNLLIHDITRNKRNWTFENKEFAIKATNLMIITFEN